MKFAWIYFSWIISRHLNDISKGIFCIITWSLCLILTSFFVPICVHMTRADYEWPFRKPLIWYDEFLRVTWENKRWQFNGNAFTSGVHTLENKMPLFLLALLLVFAFLYSLGGKKLELIEFLELQKNKKILMNIFKEATYSISL